MYTKDELKELRIKFWAGFKEFCQNYPDQELRRKKWLLNETGVSGIAFRFDFDRECAMVMLELQHKNEARRLKTFEILERYKVVLEEGFEDGLQWEFFHQREDNRQEVCRIFTRLDGVDFNRQNHWEIVYDFFLKNMIKLEENFLMLREVLKEEQRRFTI